MIIVIGMMPTMMIMPMRMMMTMKMTMMMTMMMTMTMMMMNVMMNEQGTAATVLSGLYGAMKVQGLGPEALKDQVPTDEEDEA